MPEIVIKITLQRKSGKEVHRVRGDYTFASLQSVMRQWWGASRLRWQYNDPLDGEDLVTMMGTEDEWMECVASHREAQRDLIRLTVSRVARTRLICNADGSPDYSSDDETASPTSTSAPIPVPHPHPNVPAASSISNAYENTVGDQRSTATDQLGFVTSVAGSQQTPAVNEHLSAAGDDVHQAHQQCAQVASPSEEPIATHADEGLHPTALPEVMEKPAVPRSRSNSVDAAKYLLLEIFGADVVKRLWKGTVAEGLGPVARIRNEVRDGHSKRIDVDINIRALGRKASEVACRDMDAQNYAHAVALLSAAVTLPFDKVEDDVPLRYNLACALALNGAAEEALREVTTAVAHGYRNVKHMASDPDLASISERDEFRALLQQMNSLVRASSCNSATTGLSGDNKAEVQATGSVTPSKQLLDCPLPAPLADAAPVFSTVNSSVDLLRSIFPGTPEATARTVLVRAGGDVRRAVEFMLHMS